MKFEYYEITCRVESEDITFIFRGSPAKASENALSKHRDERRRGFDSKIYWCLHGIYNDNSILRGWPIGQYRSFETAYATMQGILLPLRKASDTLGDVWVDNPEQASRLDEVISLLEDICNQSSNEERL